MHPYPTTPLPSLPIVTARCEKGRQARTAGRFALEWLSLPNCTGCTCTLTTFTAIFKLRSQRNCLSVCLYVRAYECVCARAHVCACASARARVKPQKRGYMEREGGKTKRACVKLIYHLLGEKSHVYAPIHRTDPKAVLNFCILLHR